jgi:hypothetical protein
MPRPSRRHGESDDADDDEDLEVLDELEDFDDSPDFDELEPVSPSGGPPGQGPPAPAVRERMLREQEVQAGRLSAKAAEARRKAAKTAERERQAAKTAERERQLAQAARRRQRHAGVELGRIARGAHRREYRTYALLGMLAGIGGGAVAAGAWVDNTIFWAVAASIFFLSMAALVAYAATGLGVFAEMLELVRARMDDER